MNRIPLGGYHATDMLQKLYQLKYPYQRGALSTARVEQMKEEHCYVATNYIEELYKYQHDKEFADTHIRAVYTLSSIVELRKHQWLTV